MEVKDVIKKSLEYHRPIRKYIHTYELSICNDLYQAANEGIIHYDNANFCVLSNQSNIDRVLKLSTLMPSTVTLTNLNDVVVQIDHGVTLDTAFKNSTSQHSLSEYEVLCHEPPEGLISNCPELFTEGIIQYYPNTAFYFFHPDGSTELSKRNTIEASNGTIDALSANMTNLFSAALSLDIPYIYDVPVGEYSKIVLNNMDALQRFRKFFGKTIHDIDWTHANERLDFEYELRKNVDDLSTYYKKESLKLSKNLALGTLATVLTSLFVFSDYNELLKCVTGVSGGAGFIKFVSSVFDFHIEKAQIKGNDYYFLWIFQKKADQ